MPQVTKPKRAGTIERRIGRRLAALRRALKPGVPIEALTAAAGVTGSQWRNWEAVRCGFPDYRKVVVCEVLGCELVDLFRDLARRRTDGIHDSFLPGGSRHAADLIDRRSD